MPSAPMRLCTQPGCGQLVAKGKCATHRQQQASARRRNPIHGSSRWRSTSKAYLALHPLCVGYPKGHHQRPTLAQCTDHIIGVNQRPDLAFEDSNMQSLCFDCNRRKAIAEEGGFGR